MARPKRRCRNCPDDQTPQPTSSQSATRDAAKLAADKTTGKVIAQTIITTQGEGQRLWNHVLFGTGTCIGMMQGYANLGMPGNPIPQLQELILALTNLKTQLEKNNADRNSP